MYILVRYFYIRLAPSGLAELCIFCISLFQENKRPLGPVADECATAGTPNHLAGLLVLSRCVTEYVWPASAKVVFKPVWRWLPPHTPIAAL
jgi:hypothetical protein